VDQTAAGVVFPSERVRSTTTPSDTASPAGSAAVNALKFSLQHLGKAPLPGIGIATSVLLDIINRIQDLTSVEKACRQLTKRMESLWYLVSNISEIDEGERLVKPLIEELQALTSDLESASRQNKVVAFFNSDDDVSSMESHDQTLTGIITDLTAALATATHKETSQIRKDINEAIEQLHANGNYTPAGYISRMSNNKIQRVEGKFDADNKVYGANTRVVREIHSNEIGFIGGDAFSGNVVSAFPP